MSEIKVTPLPPLETPPIPEPKPGIGQGIVPQAKPRPIKPSPRKPKLTKQMPDYTGKELQFAVTQRFIAQIIKRPTAARIKDAFRMLKDLQLSDSAAKILLPSSDIQQLIELASQQVLAPTLLDANRTSEAAQLAPLSQQQALKALSLLAGFSKGLPAPIATALIRENLSTLQRIANADYSSSIPSETEQSEWIDILSVINDTDLSEILLVTLLQSWQQRGFLNNNENPFGVFVGYTFKTPFQQVPLKPGNHGIFPMWSLAPDSYLPTTALPEQVFWTHYMPCVLPKLSVLNQNSPVSIGKRGAIKMTTLCPQVGIIAGENKEHELGIATGILPTFVFNTPKLNFFWFNNSRSAMEAILNLSPGTNTYSINSGLAFEIPGSGPLRKKIKKLSADHWFRKAIDQADASRNLTKRLSKRLLPTLGLMIEQLADRTVLWAGFGIRLELTLTDGQPTQIKYLGRTIDIDNFDQFIVDHFDSLIGQEPQPLTYPEGYWDNKT